VQKRTDLPVKPFRKAAALAVRIRFMKWSGFAVLLIVPAALLMIWVAVLLESSGIMDFIRSFSGRIMNIFRRFQ
jgi:hypothetical protein